MSGAVNFAYLEAFAAGDAALVREVLEIFLEQAEAWRAGLAAADAGFGDLAHTIKGSARGIGADALGDAAERSEQEGSAAAPALLAALDAAAGEIGAYLRARGPGDSTASV